MEKAASKRAAILQGVAEKAGAENAKAASVAAATAAKGTDPAAKAALYDRLLRAEVARLSALKNKYLSKQKGDTISVIVVRMEDIKPRMPPPALSLRLSVVPRNLLATSAARQAGAASRRAALRLESQLKAVRASDKRAAALGRVGKVQAAREAAVKARATRSLITYALHQGKRMHAIAQESHRAFEAQVRRTGAVKTLTALGAAAQVKCDAADERRAAKMRATAKTGVLAIRQAAFKSRREARRAAVVSRGETKAERCAAAATKRAAFLAARVTLAQKHMKSAHPKREMPNMEITERAAA